MFVFRRGAGWILVSVAFSLSLWPQNAQGTEAGAAPPPSGTAGQAASTLVPSTAKTLADFVPKGWFLESSATGDLNRDGLPDCGVVVSDTKDSCGSNPAKQRKLIIGLAEADGMFHRIVENESAVMLEGGTVFGFPQISIKKDVLTIDHYGGSRWRRQTHHKYQLRNGEWVLIGYTRMENDSFRPHVHETVDVNLLTGEVAGSLENEHSQSARFFEVRSPLIIDDRPSAADWTAPSVWLNAKTTTCPIVSVQSVHNRSTLFLRIQLQGSNKLAEEEVRLRDAKGALMTPLAQKEINAYGYILSSYDLKLARTSGGVTSSAQAVAGGQKSDGEDPELLRLSVEITPAHSGCNRTFSTASGGQPGGILLTKQKGLPTLADVNVRGDSDVHPFLWPVPEGD